MSEDKLYIAYGSNINLEQMAHRCPTAEKVAAAFLEGYELQFKGYATISENKETKTPVLAWRLKPQDECNLDKYEGFPKVYCKKTVELEINGENQEAMVYIMNNDNHLQMPSVDYYRAILKGYEDNNMNTEHLKTALENAIEAEMSMQEEQGFQMNMGW